MAYSADGVEWTRGPELPPDVSEQTGDVPFMTPSDDWWAFDTGHLSIGDVQVS